MYLSYSESSDSYRFSHISRILPALRGSIKTSLRIDDNGVLSLQFLSKSASPTKGTQVDSIVEFRVIISSSSSLAIKADSCPPFSVCPMMRAESYQKIILNALQMDEILYVRYRHMYIINHTLHNVYNVTLLSRRKRCPHVNQSYCIPKPKQNERFLHYDGRDSRKRYSRALRVHLSSINWNLLDL